MRIALLTAHFAPDEASNSMIATRLAENWARSGHDVWVGTIHPWYRPKAELTGPRQATVRLRRSRASNGRIRTYLRYHASLLTWIGELRAADVIVSMSPPITVGTFASIAGLGRPRIYNLQDVFPEVIIRTGGLQSRLVARVLETLEHFTYLRTSHLVTVGESQRKFLIRRGLAPEKITTIENFADNEAIRPLPTDWEYRRALGIDDRLFVALYAGNFGFVNDLTLILNAIDALQGRRIHFLLAGSGREWTRAVDFAAGRDNVSVVGHRPASEVPRLYASADAGLVTLKAGLSCCSVPSKTYTILASGRPFVAAIDTDSDIAEIARRSGAGLVSPPADVEAFSAAILRLADDRTAAANMGSRGRAYVVEHNSPSRIARSYEDLFRRLSGRT